MSKLTVSQALRAVKSTKGRIAELKTRVAQSVSHVDGVETTWDFETSKSDLAKAKERLIGLKSAIAIANATTFITFEDRELTLAEAIRRLEEFKDEMAFLPTLHLRAGVERSSEFEWDEEKERQVRVTRSVTHVSHLSERQRVEAIESLRDRFERLNNELERANHHTEVAWSD